MREFLITWRTDRRDRKRVLEWVRDEWALYADRRNDPNVADVEKHLLVDNPLTEGWWHDVVWQYMRRAEVFGLETPKGRQQVMKAVATMIDLAACVVRVYGDPPSPGEAS
jgi:hypothetical protein